MPVLILWEEKPKLIAPSTSNFFHALSQLQGIARNYDSWYSCDVMAAMLVYRATAKKVFWEFDSIVMQNLSNILPLFCTPTWLSHHASENQELVNLPVCTCCDWLQWLLFQQSFENCFFYGIDKFELQSRSSQFTFFNEI